VRAALILVRWLGFRPVDRRDVRRLVSKVARNCAPCWLEFLLPAAKPVLDGLLVFGDRRDLLGDVVLSFVPARVRPPLKSMT